MLAKNAFLHNHYVMIVPFEGRESTVNLFDWAVCVRARFPFEELSPPEVGRLVAPVLFEIEDVVPVAIQRADEGHLITDLGLFYALQSLHPIDALIDFETKVDRLTAEKIREGSHYYSSVEGNINLGAFIAREFDVAQHEIDKLIIPTP